jgi:ADP-heptose:LPS heptosyltransferase
MKLQFHIRKKKNQLHQLFRQIFYYLEYFSWFLFSLNKFKKYPSNIKSILIINEGALGDVFCTLRIVKELRKKYDSMNLTILIPKRYIKELKFLESILDINLISREDLFKNYFDLTILFSLDLFFKKYKIFLGYCVGNEYSSIKGSLLNINNLFLCKKLFPSYKHKLKQEIEICKIAKIPLNLNNQNFKIKNKKVLKFLSQQEIDKYIILHASGKNFTKLFRLGKIPSHSWPLERFAKIADYLITEKNILIILTGTKEESFINERIIKFSKNKNKIFNFAGELNIKQLVSLVSSAKLLVSVDTSIVHLAEFVNIPIINLQGPSFPEITGAYGNSKQQINLIHRELCVKCRKKEECPEKNNLCMKSITVEEVKKEINKLI